VYRQQGRDRNDNTIDVPCEKGAIVDAISMAMKMKCFGHNIYGDGKASDRIINIINHIFIIYTSKDLKIF